MIVSVTTGVARASAVAEASAPTQPGAGRLYYGWIILVALAVTEPTSWGVVYYAFGVLLEPMQRDYGCQRPSGSRRSPQWPWPST
jgi:hypothetical protein